MVETSRSLHVVFLFDTGIVYLRTSQTGYTNRKFCLRAARKDRGHAHTFDSSCRQQIGVFRTRLEPEAPLNSADKNSAEAGWALDPIAAFPQSFQLSFFLASFRTRITDPLQDIERSEGDHLARFTRFFQPERSRSILRMLAVPFAHPALDVRMNRI